MRAALLGLLIRIYPRAFRRAYGREMAQLFELQRRESRYRGVPGAFRFWIDVALDVAQGAGRQWFLAVPVVSGGTVRPPMTLHPPSERNTMDTLTQDLRYALRTLRKSPGWTLAAAATLALGLGSTIAIFSVVHDVLLRPLPYDDPERIQVVKGRNAKSGNVYQACSYPTYEIYRDAQTSFESLEAWANLTVTFQFGSGAESLYGSIVSAGVFPALGVSPVLGRAFTAEDDLASSAATVILSHRLWQQRFGGDPGILGSTIVMEEEPYTVVGVLPAGFSFPNSRSEYLLPMRIAPRAETSHYLRMIGHVKAGLSIDEAVARLSALRLEVPTGAPGETHTTGAVMHSLHEELAGDVRPQLLIFLSAVGAVLLIACLNVVSLLLSRTLGREREIALRAALGAGRWRIVRQFVAEGLLLSLLGGLAGVALAAGLVRALVLLSTRSLPRPEELGLDATSAVFAAALVLVVGTAIALTPAWKASRPNLRSSLQEGSRGFAGSRRHNRLRHGMIVAQLALTLVLLVGAALLLKSFAGLMAWESGFDPENVLVVDLELPGERYLEFDRQRSFYDELLPRLEALPGVSAAAVSSSHPLTYNSHQLIVPEGYDAAPDERTTTESFYVEPGYFDALGMSLVAGRLLDDRDGDRAVVVNETLARRYFPAGDAVGRRMQVGRENPVWRQVVGVVADVRQYSLGPEPEPTTYVPLSTGGYPYASTLLMRAELDPLELAPAVRQAIQDVDQNVPIYRLRTLEDDLRASLAVPRFRAILLGTFGVAALLLSMVGLYGVMAYWVAQRTRELGVRMALGADRRSVLRQVAGHGLVLTMAGLGIGLAAAVPAVRVLERYLFELEPYDPSSLAAALLGLGAAGFLACLLPALRASRLDPVTALRIE